MANFMIEGLKKIFGVKPRTETYITKAPSDDLKRIQHIAKGILRENSQLKVDNLKKDALIKEFQRKFQEDKEDVAIARNIKEQQIQYNKIKKERSLILPISMGGMGASYPSLFTKTNRSLGKFCGFLMRETDEGHTIFYPLIRRGREYAKVNVYSSNPMEFFKSSLGLVSQMRNGKIDTNIDFTQDGKKLAIIKEVDVLKRIVEEKVGADSKVKIINMGISDLERREFESIIQSKSEEIKELYSKLGEQNDMIVQYESRLNETESVANHSSKERDLAYASNQNLLEKAHKMTVETAKAVSAVQDSKIEQVLTERQNMAFSEAFNGMVDKLTKRLPESKREEAKREAEEDLLRAMEILKKVEKPTTLVMTKAKKGEEEAPPAEEPPKAK